MYVDINCPQYLRYPRLKWDMVGWRPDDVRALGACEAFDGSVPSRLGYYSDGFMGNASHYAMYVLPGESDFSEADTLYAIQEGEISDGTAYKLKPRQVMIDCHRYHQTALHRGGDAWNLVSRTWKNNGDYDEVARSLGYRFRLVKATLPARLPPGSQLDLSLEMANDGCAPIMNPRKVEIVLRIRSSGETYVLEVDQGRGNRLWLPGPGETKTLNVSGGLPTGMQAGVYEVLLNLPDPYPSIHDRPEYSIRLANQGLWEETSGYNALKHSLSLNPSAPGARYSGKQWFAKSHVVSMPSQIK